MAFVLTSGLWFKEEPDPLLGTIASSWWEHRGNAKRARETNSTRGP